MIWCDQIILCISKSHGCILQMKSKHVLGLFVKIQTVALLYIQVHAYPCHDWIILNNSVLPIRHTVRNLLRKVNNCSLSVSKSLIKKNVNRWKKNLTPTLTILCIAFCSLTYSIPLSKDFKKDDRWVRFYPSNCHSGFSVPPTSPSFTGPCRSVCRFYLCLKTQNFKRKYWSRLWVIN